MRASPHEHSILSLKKGEERRLTAGHLWIFSNEIDVGKTPLKSFAAGETVSIESSRGDFIGTGYVNPHSLIAARLCSRDDNALTADWFRTRLADALALRQQLYPSPWYRLVHGEGDLLPGLVIDRYDQVLVVQITTAGMEKHKELLIDVLTHLLQPATIVLRNDTPVRELEQLDLYQQTVLGESVETLLVEENGLKYQVAGMTGQKTGWFFDHRENRRTIAPLVAGKRVLDCYCYAGAWGLNALAAGAESVLGIDASKAAVSSATDNAALNGLADRYQAIAGDAVETMRSMKSEREKFDVIILDPPAFIKRKKDYRAGLDYYALNNRLAVQLLAPGGILVSASCSQALDAKDLQNVMLKAARRRSLDLQILGEISQGSDHPVNAAMPETRYLKGFIGRVSRLAAKSLAG